MKKDLRLSLKTKWFEMTKAGIKTEDYRELNEYWFKRFCEITWFGDSSFCWNDVYYKFKEFDCNVMTLGYPANYELHRIIRFEHLGIEIRTGNPEWGAEPGKLYFVIKHGNLIEPDSYKQV